MVAKAIAGLVSVGLLSMQFGVWHVVFYFTLSPCALRYAFFSFSVCKHVVGVLGCRFEAFGGFVSS